MRTALMCAGLLAAAALLAACGETETDAGDFENIASAPETPTPAPGQDWLGDDADALPERWLVTQMTGEPVAADDERVQRIGARFDTLDAVFVESRRMLANRSLQLHRMLAEAGIDESMSNALAVFEPPDPDRAVGNFSQYIGYYVNLRTQGVEREQARITLWEDTLAEP